MAPSRCWRRSRPRTSGSKRDNNLWKPLLRGKTSCSSHCKPRRSCVKPSRCDGNRRQSSLTYRAQVADGSRHTSAFRGAVRWQSSGSGWPRRRRPQPRLLQRHQQWTLISTRWSGNGRTRSTAFSPNSSSMGESEEVKLSAEEKLLLREACKKTKRPQARLEETATDVVLFQEPRWTAPRLPQQWSRIHKKGWDVTLSPALQSEGSESASGGGTGIACGAGITATDIRGLDTSVEWPPQHRVKLRLDAVLPGGLVVVSVYLTTAIGYSEQNIAFLNTLGQVLRAIDLPLKLAATSTWLEMYSSSEAGFTQYARALLRRATTRRRAWTLQAKARSSISSWYRRSCTRLSER